MGTDRELIAEVLAAGADAGDPGWEIPLWKPYRKTIESDVADIKNVADHWFDSSMMAGLSLREFAGDVPWAHLDTGSAPRPGPATPGWPTRATPAPPPALLPPPATPP